MQLEEKMKKELEEKQKKELEKKLEEEKKKKIEQQKIKEKQNNNIKNEEEDDDDIGVLNINEIENKKKAMKPKNTKKQDFDFLEKGDPRKRLMTSNSSSNLLTYSYECQNLMYLHQVIYVGTKFVEFKLTLKNIGIHDWPPNKTKLVFEQKYQIKGKNVKLNSLAKDEVQEYNVRIDGLGNLPAGEYETGVYFNVNSVNMGNMMKLKITIKNKEVDPIMMYMDKINDFRKEFNLSKEEYSDNGIYELLSENDFDFGQAFLTFTNDN